MLVRLARLPRVGCIRRGDIHHEVPLRGHGAALGRAQGEHGRELRWAHGRDRLVAADAIHTRNGQVQHLHRKLQLRVAAEVQNRFCNRRRKTGQVYGACSIEGPHEDLVDLLRSQHILENPVDGSDGVDLGPIDTAAAHQWSTRTVGESPSLDARLARGRRARREHLPQHLLVQHVQHSGQSVLSQVSQLRADLGLQIARDL
mmetsp:Transcript_28920/g.96262  ORF Transcript_28920/g.96262 Transcript_28920/m.96262 type:complete len:202 (+) Transcript_28920:2933-3538(+)